MNAYDGSEPLADAQHERFACELAKGASQDEAYALAGYKRHSGNAHRLSVNERVSQRVAWLKKQAAAADVLTIAEKRKFLARVVRAKVEETEPTSDLWQGVEDTEQGRRYKLPDKLRAITIDNDLAGEGSEAKSQSAIAALLGRLRG